MKLQVSNKLYDISGKRNIRVDHLDGGNDKSESVGQSFFRVFVDKEVDEELEIDKNDLQLPGKVIERVLLKSLIV